MHAMTDPVQTWTFLTAGNATITLRSSKTGKRYTFKVRRPNDDAPRFVSLLSGPDNEGDFTYVGLLTDQGELRLTRKSKLTDESAPVAAFRFFLRRLALDDFGPLEVFHENRCGRCGRKLTVPESVVSGIGPECADKVGGWQECA